MTIGDRLSGADEANLLLDRGDDVYVVTVVGVCGPGGFVSSEGGCDIDALRASVAGSIATMPRLRCRLAGRPGRPRLVEVPLDLAAHVRMVDPVDGAAGLDLLCARMVATRLPRDRPLWELLIVPGAEAGRVAWVFRVHHALADGNAVARLLDALFDERTDAAATAAGSTPPTSPRPPRPPRRSPRPMGGLLSDLLRRLPRTALLGPRGPALRMRRTSFPLSAVSRAARGLGATVNDVLLAAVGEGARSAYAELGEGIPAELPVSVPVLLPAGAGRPNQVSAVVVRIPLDDEGVVDRVHRVAAGTGDAIARTRARPLPWFSATRTGARIMRWFIARQRMIGMLTTSVRGPDGRRSLAGAPVERIWAPPLLAGDVRAGVAAVSYADVLTVTVLWSERIAAAGGRLADGVQAGLDEIVSSAP